MNDSINEMQKTALFVSPHLDDVIFSCGGTLAKMRGEGWRTILCTIFTKSVANPQGFALACQLDKNLAPDVDYMKLRRSEDYAAAKILNVAEVLHLNFPEAPHRGYNSARELFAGIKPEDEIHKPIAEYLTLLDDIHQPDLIFAPQGLGDHCDHRQTIKAVQQVFAARKINWYFDTPYVIRQPDAKFYQLLPPNLTRCQTDVTSEIDSKIAACAEYTSQIEFQFGGKKKMEETLRKFHSISQIGEMNIYSESFLTN